MRNKKTTGKQKRSAREKVDWKALMRPSLSDWPPTPPSSLNRKKPCLAKSVAALVLRPFGGKIGGTEAELALRAWRHGVVRKRRPLRPLPSQRLSLAATIILELQTPSGSL
jgi:hypothetical protein